MKSQDNIDQSKKAEHGSSIATATIMGMPRDILLGILLGISAVVNIAAIVFITETYKEDRLKEYSIDYFQTHEFADLKTEVIVTEKLIAAKCGK